MKINNKKGGKNMKGKKNITMYLSIVLLLLVGVSVRYVAGTYAKYTSQVSGSGTISVAKWAFPTDNASSSITLSLSPNPDVTSLVNDKIAPGTSGTFDLVLSNATSDVGVAFTVSFAGSTNLPQNLVLTYGGNSFNPSSGTITGTIAQGDSITLQIGFSWPYYTDATEDGEDTTDGIAATDLTLSAAIVGSQTNPTAHVTTTATAS